MIHARRTNRRTSDWDVRLPLLRQIAADEKTDVDDWAQGFHAKKRPTVTRILYALKNTRHPKTLYHILTSLNEIGLIENPLILRAIQSIAAHYHDRVSSIETFPVNTTRMCKQFSMLLRHLFANYEVPLFMDSVWLGKGGSRFQSWFKHLGNGKSLRTALGVPITVTKKIAHHFGRAPAHYTVTEALRWGQVHAIGGDRSLVEQIRGTRLSQTFTHDAFWVSFLRFLINSPESVDQRDMNRLVEYIFEIRFVPRRILIAGGQERLVSPPQPNFNNFKGQCLKKLLTDAAAWTSDDKIAGFEWHPSEIAPFQHTEQIQHAEQNCTAVWTIYELLSSEALIREEQSMKHCVGDDFFSNACYEGHYTIWSLGCDRGKGRENLLTIEVQGNEKITEILGYENRLPTPNELNIVQQWARINRLHIA